LIDTTKDAVTWTFQYHGAASGTVLADERLAGLNPYSGSELCTAVETMYSLTYLYQALGINDYADRAELTAFNAFPTMVTGDHWGHQYMAEPNQPWAKDLPTAPFYNVRAVGQAFGLEPNFPCCTVNHPQGWPKWVMASYAKNGDNGLVHAQLSPTTVNTKLSSGNVQVSCDTAYPFGYTLTYTIQSDGNFDFYVRVPSWATSSSSIQVNSDSASALSPDDTTRLHKLSITGGKTTVTYKLASSIRTESRQNDTVAVYNGPVLYALEIPNPSVQTLPPHTWVNNHWDNSSTLYSNTPSQSHDWEYFNTTAWNIAIDPSTLAFHTNLTDSNASLHSPIFESGAPPTWIEARGCVIDWPLWNNSVPDVPPEKTSRKCVGDQMTVRLVPYGSAKLHMSDIPTIDFGGSNGST
jgi:hypothetical protein